MDGRFAKIKMNLMGEDASQALILGSPPQTLRHLRKTGNKIFAGVMIGTASLGGAGLGYSASASGAEFLGSVGANASIGAGYGGGADLAGQTINQVLKTGTVSLNRYDFGSVTGSALQGSMMGGALGAAGPSSSRVWSIIMEGIWKRCRWDDIKSSDR